MMRSIQSLVISAMFTFSSLSEAQQLHNTVSCAIINDGFFYSAPVIFKTQKVVLGNVKEHRDIYRDDKLAVSAASATKTTLEAQKSWISSFELSVEKQGEKVLIRSFPRQSENGEMGVYLSFPSESSGELILDCSTG